MEIWAELSWAEYLLIIATITYIQINKINQNGRPCKIHIFKAHIQELIYSRIPLHDYKDVYVAKDW